MNRIKIVLLIWEILSAFALIGPTTFGADGEVVPPKPVPIPNVKPDTPVASIVVTDGDGLPVTDEIDVGQQMTLSSSKAIHGKGKLSLVWLIEPKLKGYTIPVGTIDPDGVDIGGTMILTTPKAPCDIMIMQMVALGDKVAWQRIKIRCGQGAQPPPPGPIPPGPVPPIPPTPVTAPRLFMALVEESVLKRTPEQMQVLSAIGVWNSFRTNGGDWRFYDAAATTEAKGKKAIADIAAWPTATKLPALVTYNFDTGAVLDVRPMPMTVKDLQSVYDKFTGK